MIGRTVWILCVVLTGSAGAQKDAEMRESLTPRAWRIAPEVSRYRYREPGVMTNEGTLYGIVGSYTFRDLGDGSLMSFGADSNDTLRFEGRLAFGEMEYDGSYMDGTPLSTDGIDDFLFDLRMLWGRELPTTRIVNAVHLGLGYRYLNDDSSSQPGGYERESNYLYAPLGSRKDWKLKDRWRLSLTSELDVLIIGRQISHLGDANPRYSTVRNWQWPGFGAGLCVEVRHEGQDVDLALAPFLRYWWIDDSSVDDSSPYLRDVYEPENNTFEYGLSFVVRF